MMSSRPILYVYWFFLTIWWTIWVDSCKFAITVEISSIARLRRDVGSCDCCAVLVVGCADVAVPDSAWVERKADLLTVRCSDSQETWYLTCKGRRWVGTMANCSNGKNRAASGRFKASQRKSWPAVWNCPSLAPIWASLIEIKSTLSLYYAMNTHCELCI